MWKYNNILQQVFFQLKYFNTINFPPKYSFSYIPYIFVHCIFIFTQFKIFSDFPETYSLTHRLFRSESESEGGSIVTDSVQHHRLHSPWNSPGQNTGLGRLSLLQKIFPPGDQTKVSNIAGRFFTSWGTREAHMLFNFQTFGDILVSFLLLTFSNFFLKKREILILTNCIFSVKELFKAAKLYSQNPLLAIPFLQIYTQEKRKYTNRPLYRSVHSSITHNSQQWKWVILTVSTTTSGI